MKKRFKQILPLILISSILIPSSVWAVEEPETPPLNPAFVQYQADREAGLITTQTLDGYPTGHVPSPLTRYDEDESLTLDASASLPASYDLRVTGRISPIRDQNPFGSCWTFACMASLESYLKPKETVDLSENNLMLNHGFDYGPDDGGNRDMSIAYLSRWSGPVSESSDPYGSTKKTGLLPIYHIQSAEFLPKSESAIKQAIISGGALDTSIYAGAFDNPNYYNKSKTALYYNGSAQYDHAVSIVGWDDNYSRNNFSSPPPNNGAWIIRNSWGSDWGDNGYFYLSYYDSYAGNLATAFHNAEAVNNYKRIYQYDPFGNTNTRGYGAYSAWGANVFTSTASESLVAISTYASTPGTTVAIEIYTGLSSNQPTSGQLRSSQSQTFTHAGYYTINLNTPVNLVANEKFSVVIKYTTPQFTYPIPVEEPVANYSSRASANAKESFIDDDGTGEWFDLGARDNANVCIKAYTAGAAVATLESINITKPANKLIYQIGEPLDISGLEVTGNYSDGSKRKETVSTQNITGFNSSKASVNQVLTISIGGKTTTYVIQIKGTEEPFANCYYHTHIQNVGWQDTRKNGELSGTSGRSLRLEAIQIKVDAPGYDLGIQYSTHIQNIGWQSWRADGGLSGTSGRGLRLEAIMIKLTGQDAKLFNVYYRTHVQNIGWLNWANNGEKSGTAGYGYRLEGIQIKVLPKGLSLADINDETDSSSAEIPYIELN